MRVLVTGSRSWREMDTVTTALDWVAGRSQDPVVLVAGGAKGADTMAESWARNRGFSVEIHRPDWSTGRAAGIRRNEAMLDAGADLVVAFWDGESRGTSHCISKARERGMKVWIVSPQH